MYGLMDIQELAAWGEFLGGIGGLIAAFAVVASLVFVGFQVRHSANAAQASVRQAVSESVIDLAKLRLNEPVRQALRKDQAGDAIDETERELLGAYFTVFWRTNENAFYQFRKGLLEADEWRSHRQVVQSTLINSRAAKFTFDLFAENFVMPPTFAAEVETILKEIANPENQHEVTKQPD